MPTLTTTIEDISPLLSYNGWVPGSSADDGSCSLYSDSNFMKTNTQNTTMTFTYNGTDLTLYGAQRSNHGNYQVVVDGTANSPQSGYNAQGNFQVVLFQSHGLSQGNHTVTLTNQGANSLYLDIDFVTWTSTFGNASDPLGIITVDDQDASFVYSGSDWSNSPTDVGKYFAGTGHSTSTYNATAQVTFSGDAISLYGPVGASGSPYNVQMDNSKPVSYNANRAEGYQVLLYHANNLGSGNHTLVFTCTPVQSQFCAVDYINIYGTAGSSSSSTTPGFDSSQGGTGSASHSNNSALSAGDIVGIVLGSVAVVVAGAIVALYIVARRKSNAKQETLATFQPIGGVGSSPMQQSTFSQGQSSMVDPRYQDYPVQSLLNRSQNQVAYV